MPLELSTILGEDGYVHVLPRTPEAISRLVMNRFYPGVITDSNVTTIPKLMPREVALDAHVALRTPRAKTAPPNISGIKLPSYSDAASSNSLSLIKAVGMEIEGGWALPQSLLGFHVVGDSSVYASPNAIISTLGEVHVGPYANGLIDKQSVEAVYPQDVNETCGLHVHLSFPSVGVYALFMSVQFHDWFLQGLKVWRKRCESAGDPLYATFWNRINGLSKYCKPNYTPSNANAQLTDQGNRYTAVNYCKGKHDTIEVRVLPGFKTATEAVDAAREVVRLFRLWGSKMKLPSPFVGPHVNVPKQDTVKYLPKYNVFAVPLSVIRTPTVSRCGLSTCYKGVIQLPHGCALWCPTCSPDYFARQLVKHDFCWHHTNPNGATCSWSPFNVRDVPSTFTTTYNVVTSACPICDKKCENHDVSKCTERYESVFNFETATTSTWAFRRLA